MRALWRTAALGASLSATLFVLPSGWAAAALALSSLALSGLWAAERWRAERRLRQLASAVQHGKLEVSDDPAAAALHAALNRARTERGPAASSSTTPQMVTTLALALPERPAYTAGDYERLGELTATIHRLAQRTNAEVLSHGNGIFVLVFGLRSATPLAQSGGLAVAVARRLRRLEPALVFGLSSGLGVIVGSSLGPVVLATPLEDATRLLRLAQSWPEHALLCPEPLAHLLRPSHAASRTTLELTYSAAPSLRVYSLELEPVAVAV